MNDREWIDANRNAAARGPRLDVMFAVCVGIGIVGFAIGAYQGMRSAQAYWVNFLYWTAIAQAGVVLAALVHITQGRWGGALVRLGLLQAAFLPVAVVLYLGIALIAPHLVPWAATPVPEKVWWLNLTSFLLRDFAALAVLTICSMAFAYFVLRPDAGALAQAGASHIPAWLTRGFRGVEPERERSKRILSWLAPLLVFLYCCVYTLLGFDMIMSLDPHWYSTLFGAYYFITTMYLGIAALAVLGMVVRRRLRLESELVSKQFHDLGKLLFAFCFLSGDFLWSQFLVLWYGNLPEEVGFVVRRVQQQPWRTLSFIVLFGGFIIPFIILLNRRIKQIPETLAAVALLVLAVGFCERLLMILPSLHPEPGAGFPIGAAEFMLSLGFAGLYGLALLWALRHLPLIPFAENANIEKESHSH